MTSEAHIHPSNCTCTNCVAFREGIPGVRRGSGPDQNVDRGQCLHAQLTLGEHGWHCAACLRTFLPSGETGAEQEAVRLRYQLTDTRSALQKRDQEVAELEKLAAMRLEEINEIKRTREQERDYADVCYQNEQLGKRLHAAANEIMALRGERDALKQRLDSATRWPVAEG